MVNERNQTPTSSFTALEVGPASLHAWAVGLAAEYAFARAVPHAWALMVGPVTELCVVAVIWARRSHQAVNRAVEVGSDSVPM